MLSFFPQFADRVSCQFLTKTDDLTLPESHVRLHQVHGNRTIIAREPMQSTEKADGALTDLPGLSLTVRAADCQNFAFYAPNHHIGGVLHAGWRGMLCGAIGGFLETLRKEFSVDPSECFVAAGPSLCLSCAEYKDPDHQLRREVDAKYLDGDCVDLRQIADGQLVQFGIQGSHYDRHPDCTRCSPKKYISYRGGDRGLVESGVSNVLVLSLL